MKETILSVGIDIGTSTTQLIFSKLTIENEASSYVVPRINIVDKEVTYRSKIYFTPLLSQTEIDAEKVKKIIEAEYKAAGMKPEDLQTGAVIITGETARKHNANTVLASLSSMAGDFVVATAGPDLESVLSAKGAGADAFSEEHRQAVANIDIGGGTTDIAVISLGDTVISHSLKLAGDDFDAAIIRYLRKKHNLLVGDRTAEDVKIRIGGVYERVSPLSMQVKGRDLVTGLPKTVEVSSTEMLEAFREIILQILEVIHQVLEETPPELAADIATRGILLTGGGSMLFGMDELIQETTGIQTTAVDDPISAVAIGTGRYTEFIEGKQTKA